LVRQLDRQFHYDRIEVESEEGIAIGVLKDFEQKSILRIYTTLAQMVEHKDVPMTRIVKYRLDREKQSFATARCVLVPSGLHRDEMIAGGVMPERVRVNPIGIADPGVRRVMAAWPPLFVLVGSPDLRKGFDRIRPVMEVLAACSQSYRFALVSEAGENAKMRFGLLPPLPGSVEMAWYSRISDRDLFCLYSQASVVLHLARYESFGLPLIEAAAVGVPVVATRVGIAPELMEGALERFVVNGDEPVAVAAALMAAVRERDQIGEMLRKGYEERFTVQRMVDGWLCEVLATDNGTSDRGS
jgi:glycosyltransferase involved in cell wall biosynthesis